MPKTIKELQETLNTSMEAVLDFIKENELGDYNEKSEIEDEIYDLLLDQKEEFEQIAEEDENIVHLKPPFIVKTLAEAINVKANILVGDLMKMGVFASLNQDINQETVEKILKARGLKLVIDKREKAEIKEEEEEKDTPENKIHEEKEGDRIPRPPIVAFMGHVDHGKTSLQDAYRNTNVIDGEAGGITQHTATSFIEHKGQHITFIDTPGHEAFTEMRKRGADITDLAILVIAADDGVNNQTKETIRHIQDAKVPFIIAMNKMDLPNANPDSVQTQLQQHNILTEDWGGDIGVVKVSALKKTGLDELAERIFLETEMLELTTNPKLPGKGVVVESELGQGTGATANIIVSDGVFKVGDIIICGQYTGKVRSLVDASGKRLKKAGASMPVQIIGLNGVPEVGSIVVACKDKKEAKLLSEKRSHLDRHEKLGVDKISTIEDFFSAAEETKKKVYRIILKTDVKGTAEAISISLNNITSDNIKLDIVQTSVGGINENDIDYASSTDSTIFGFHVRVNPGVNKKAKSSNVEIKLYSVIYELVEEIRTIMTGLVDDTQEEVALGKAEIREVFKNKNIKICGCMAVEGTIKPNAHARVYRDKDMIYNGKIRSLRRFKDDVKSVKAPQECGIKLDNFNDFEVGDNIEVYEFKTVTGKL